MRTIFGRADHVVVVGAGLAGLSAALHLRGAGREVTVLERADHPGGRVGRHNGSHAGRGYHIDSGATVLTMPELIDEALAAVGSSREDAGLRISRLDPAYHARFADGSTIDVHADPEAMAAEVERVCGAAEAARYRDLRRWLEQVFTVEFDRFIAANFDSPLDLVATRDARRDVARLVALGGFGRLGPQVARRLRDPRLQRVFTFQALYAGLPPAKALGVYGAIAHMDTSLGVYFPEGGMHRIATALADALTAAGGTVRLGTEVAALEFGGAGVTAVVCADGGRVAADAVVLTPDLPVVDRLLAGRARGTRRRTRWSPSAVVLHGTVPTATSATWGAQAHHTIDFGAAWDSTFAELTARRGRGALMRDPSLLLTRPGLSDPALTVGGDRELLSVLAPCPNLVSADLDWQSVARPYAAELLTVLEGRGYKAVGSDFTVEHIDTPATWAAAGMAAGTPFSAAHTFRQTGPFRRRNLVRGLGNVVLAGCGTTPGVGVPTTLISGRLAAQRIVGGGAGPG